MQVAALDEIDAFALGEQDWTLGKAWLLQQVAAYEVPVLAANLTCDGSAPFPATRSLSRGGMNIGLVGVTAGEVPGCDVTDPWDALQRSAAELSDADVLVGIVPARLSRANQGPDLGQGR